MKSGDGRDGRHHPNVRMARDGATDGYLCLSQTETMWKKINSLTTAVQPQDTSARAFFAFHEVVSKHFCGIIDCPALKNVQRPHC